MISLIKHLETFIYPKTTKKDMLLTHFIGQYEFCNENKIFHHAKENLEKYYLKNEKFLKKNIKNNLISINNTSNDINNDVNYDI